MNLYALLQSRAAEGRPIRVGLIGAGKFGSMFLAQARTTPGMHVLAVADLSIPRARQALRDTGWEEERISAGSFAQALNLREMERTLMSESDGSNGVVRESDHPSD